MRLALSAALAASMAVAGVAAKNGGVWNKTALTTYERDASPYLPATTATTAAAFAALAAPVKRSVINCTGKKAVTDLMTTKAMFLFAYLAIFLTSISGNSLVVYVVLTTKNMQTVTNIFITNLAISDLLVCCTSLWLTPVYTYVGHWIWGGWLCYGLPLFQGTSIFISTLTLMSIAVDRYFVICRHSKSIVNINERMSMQVCIAIITLIWMMSLLLVMPYAVHMRMAYVQQPCDFWLCVEDWAMEDLKSLYGVIVLSLQFAVPFLIIGYSYVRIWFFLNQRRRKSRRSIFNSERESETETQRKKRLLRMLVTMVVLFAICWFPFNLLNILRDLKMDAWLKPYFSFFFLSAHLISMTTTACNPILYAWMNHAFRDEFVRVVPLLGVICRRLAHINSSDVNSSEKHANGRRYGFMRRADMNYGSAVSCAKKCGRCRAVSLDGATSLQNGTINGKKDPRVCPHVRPQRKSTLLSLLSGNVTFEFGRSSQNRVASSRTTRDNNNRVGRNSLIGGPASSDVDHSASPLPGSMMLKNGGLSDISISSIAKKDSRSREPDIERVLINGSKAIPKEPISSVRTHMFLIGDTIRTTSRRASTSDAAEMTRRCNENGKTVYDVSTPSSAEEASLITHRTVQNNGNVVVPSGVDLKKIYGLFQSRGKEYRRNSTRESAVFK